jgi:hypothetical protein
MIFGKYDERMHAVAGAEKHDRPARKSDPQPAQPASAAAASEKTTIES